MDKYRIRLLHKLEKITDLPETPFCFRAGDSYYMVFEESGDKGSFQICGLNEGNCTHWGRCDFWKNLKQCKDWELVESSITIE